ncbi:MAG: hypothetical protein GY861_22120 [bacterium]|nr:hypothetical protein [bacterium]
MYVIIAAVLKTEIYSLYILHRQSCTKSGGLFAFVRLDGENTIEPANDDLHTYLEMIKSRGGEIHIFGDHYSYTMWLAERINAIKAAHEAVERQSSTQ